MSEIGKAFKKASVVNPPVGWTPGLTFDGHQGTLVLTPGPGKGTNTAPGQDKWNEILRLHGYDPEHFYVFNDRVGQTTHVKDGEIYQIWYKVQFARKLSSLAEDDSLREFIRGPRKPVKAETDNWLHIVLTDQHVGKSAAAGGGTDTIAQRWIDGVVKAIRGRKWKGINLAFAGDIIEGYVSQNGANIMNTDLTLPDQLITATRLVVETINLALESAEQVVVAAVPGNHGETTRTQKVPMKDNFDIYIVQAAQAQFERWLPGAHLSFNYPAVEYGEVVYGAGGTNICLVHGHLFKGQMKGAEEWWRGQIVNARPPHSAHVLIAGHFHNFQMSNFTYDRWIIFGPSLEDESVWFANQTGATSRPGVYAFEMVDGAPLGAVF